MRRSTLSIFLLSTCLTGMVHAQSPQRVVKCTGADGKVSYGDQPCPGGRLLPSMPAPSAVSSDAGVATGDGRALLELEKARTERAKREAIEGRERRAQARSSRVAVRQAQHCDKMILRRKWLEEDAARADTPARQAAARTKLKRQTESMAVECPV